MPVLFLNIFQKDPFGGVQGEAFHAFLHICFLRSTCFSVSKVIPPGYELVPNAPERLLAPYQIKVITPQSWYGYEQIHEDMVQCVYPANQDTLQILSQFYQDVFLKNRKRLPKVPIDTIGKKPKRVGTLENLCFFSGHKMILGTLSHERICSTNLIDEDFARQLMGIGKWSDAVEPQFGIDRVFI